MKINSRWIISKSICGALCTCLATISFNANAVLLEGSFSATVTSNQEYVPGVGWIYNDLVGETITGGLLIDTNLAPSDSTPTSYFRTYSSIANDWMDASVSLNGVVTDFEGTATQRVQTVNETTTNNIGYDQWGTYVDDSYNYTVDGYTYYQAKAISFDVMDSLSAFLETDNLDQVFSWDGSNSNTSGSGSFQVDSYTYYYGSYYDESYYRVGFDLNTVTLTTVVPVPTAFWLFGSGLVGLIGVARRKKNIISGVR